VGRDALTRRPPGRKPVIGIGKTAVNQPFFNLLMEKARNGNNIDWIPFWEELEKKVKVEGFEDYIPPYKNLGAIFIKAYTKAMGDED
jgi:hypothetical protein